MDDEESARISVLLSEWLDRTLVGTPERVNIGRGVLINEYITNSDKNSIDIFYGGSRSEGIRMTTSDIDTMYIDNTVVVTYPGQSVPPDRTHTSVLYMREADNCQPGYVSLQLGHLGQIASPIFANALVTVGDAILVSSDIYREEHVKISSEAFGIRCTSHGPSSTMATGGGLDTVHCFPCKCWPSEAQEWITRPRLYGWPSQTLIDNIIHQDCHLVPVGDQSSPGDTLLQWRISFATAERRLIHSLSHIQFKVYVLLKYVLKQIQPALKAIIGDEDILCSYFVKTAIFWAVENSHQTFWQNKNIFACFWFCINILIAWVKAGNCPNYFIPANNMFKRKVWGQNQQILFIILKQLHHMKWMCLSYGRVLPALLLPLCNVEVQLALVHPETTQEIEYKEDMEILATLQCMPVDSPMKGTLQVLLNSQSEVDEVFTYYHIVRALNNLAMEMYPDHTAPTDNKTRYRSLRKCKHWLLPRASLGTNLLYLATFHFKIGNYRKSLEMCKHILSRESYYLDPSGRLKLEQKENYKQKYCRRGYTSIRKLKTTMTNKVDFTKESQCLPHLYFELSKSLVGVHIPPIPYAIFLSFMCCHALGDTRGRDAALRKMTTVKYDELQGGHKHWIVHTLLGICHQTVGDNRMAVRAYWDSHQSQALWQEFNPALERIAVVYLVMYCSIMPALERIAVVYLVVCCSTMPLNG